MDVNHALKFVYYEGDCPEPSIGLVYSKCVFRSRCGSWELNSERRFVLRPPATKLKIDEAGTVHAIYDSAKRTT